MAARVFQQDMPPKGGFPEIRAVRNLPQRGPTGFTIVAVSSALMAFGFYRIGQYNIEQRRIRFQERQDRIAVLPYLQAETDRRYLERKAELDAYEAKVMAKEKGWVVGESTYKTRWAPRPTRNSF